MTSARAALPAAADVEIDVEVEHEAWRHIADVEAVAERAARAALAGSEPAAVAILLTDDDAVRDLNHRFRGKDSATNVLSFPAAPMPGGPLGDVALAFGVCAREARGRNLSLADHLSHLVIHGVLHLMGHDHQDDAEARLMETLEIGLLAELGVADPYGSQDAGDREETPSSRG